MQRAQIQLNLRFPDGDVHFVLSPLKLLWFIFNIPMEKSQWSCSLICSSSFSQNQTQGHIFCVQLCSWNRQSGQWPLIFHFFWFKGYSSKKNSSGQILLKKNLFGVAVNVFDVAKWCLLPCGIVLVVVLTLPIYMSIVIFFLLPHKSLWILELLLLYDKILDW